MDMPILDRVVYAKLKDLALQLENVLNADNFLYIGEINPAYKSVFVSEMENLAKEQKHDTLAFHINTPGGSAEAVEMMVEVMRHHYKEVYFIVQDSAYSAGTILCMSGDKIYMNYSSTLGPIDPQVYSNGKLIPAQGYLDQFDKILEKSKDGTITPLEIQIIRDLDIGDLHFYSQARNLTVTLLKKWLVMYKFKDWTIHSTTHEKVTQKEKEERAEYIAKMLGNNAYWHSHGRHIGIKTLQEKLKLKIEDYSFDAELSDLIKDYNMLAVDYARKQGYQIFVHNRTIFS